MRVNISALLLVVLLLSGSGAWADGLLKATQVLPGLKADLEKMEVRLDEQNSRYDYLYFPRDRRPIENRHVASATVLEAFKQAGASPKAHRYSDSWGMWLGNSWMTKFRPFYKIHIDRLSQSIRVIERQGGVSAADLQYLKSGLAAWWQKEAQLGQDMQMLVDALAKRAKAYGTVMELREKYQSCYQHYSGRQLESCQAPYKPQIQNFEQESNQWSSHYGKSAEVMAKVYGVEIFSALGADSRIAVAEVKGNMVEKPEMPIEESQTPCDPLPPVSQNFARDFMAAYQQHRNQLNQQFDMFGK